MKIHHIFLTLILLGFLSGCRVPFAPVPATLTPTLTATSTRIPTLTPTITLTPVPTRTRLPTETITATRTPRPSGTVVPTGTSPYPVSAGTPIPTDDFAQITTENTAKLTAIFQIIQQNIWTTSISRDGKQLFVATSRGLYVYDRTGQQLAYWPSILLPGQPCEACISVNTNGTRFAIMTHKEGKWLAQVYNIFDNNANLLIEKPLNATFQGIPNEVSVALSPDGLLLAYGTANGSTVLMDMNSGQELLTSNGGATSAIFSPDGAYFIIRHARQMLVWKTPIWKNPINLLLPTDDATYTFSTDGKRLAIAETDKITAYRLDTLKLSREIAVETPKDLKRNWQIAFLDANILAGYATRWNTAHTKATIDVAQWNLETGETLQFGSHETDAPDGLSALWGATIPATPLLTGPLVFSDQYDAFRFVDQDQLLINSAHSACWLKLFSAETTCYNDPDNRVFASQTEAYRELQNNQNTILQEWARKTVTTVALPYPILGIDWLTYYQLVNVKDTTVDIYASGKNDLVNSFPGTLINFTENDSKMVLSLQQKPSGMIITMWDKLGRVTPYLKKIDFILKPLAMGPDGQVYFLQESVGQPGVVLKTISGDGTVSDVALLPLSLPPEAMSIDANGTFAFGMKDGNVTIVSRNGLQLASFQAAYTPIQGIALTADGRTLAVISADGLRIFAVLP